MIARGFKSMVWVAAVGGAALGCYMLSLQVATERADLAKVERRIIAAKQQIRSLQTELGTRGRLSQLERWNSDVLALSAPATGQFLQNELLLARFDVNDGAIADSAEVRMASMETREPGPAAAAPAGAGPRHAVEEKAPPAVQPAIVHRAGYVTADPPPAAARRPAVATAPHRPTAVAAAAAPKPARRLGADLADELGVAARGEQAATPVVARPDRSRAALKGSEASRTDAAPARAARADAARPTAGQARTAKAGESRTAVRGSEPRSSGSGAGSGGNR